MWRRLSAVFTLFLLTPLIAEYMSGSLPFTMIAILPVLALMYGSGAVAIRELVRQTGRGWPSLILLATAYAVLEEGLVTQSLFNPNYLHLRLLDYGFIHALGTGLPWLIYVIGIHIFWSLSVPIALTESLFLKQRSTPWLGKIGLGVFVILMILGSAMIATFTYKQMPFMATSAQLGLTAAIILSLTAFAFLIPKPVTDPKGNAPHPLILFLVPLIIGSVFLIMEFGGGPIFHLPWVVSALGLMSLEALMLAFMVVFTRNRTWTDFQRFALMAGGIGVYMWFGFITDFTLHPTDLFIGHAGLVVAFAALCLLAGVRSFTHKKL